MGGEFEVGDKVSCKRREADEELMCEVLETRMAGKKQEFYVHYSALNKRMDEWVEADRLAHLPPESVERDTSFEIDEPDSATRFTRTLKRKHDEENAFHKSNEQLDPVAEKEHEEKTKLKNIQNIVFGKYEVDAWYFSPYPEEYGNCQTLYICEFCLKYMRKPKTLQRHRSECGWTEPPGRLIYQHPRPEPFPLAVYEVDGAVDKLYCQNLCLLAKLFLDHKTLYFDVDMFLFYILCEVDEGGARMVGYFSKEKDSADDYNLACILTLPPHQRKGYGKFIMSFSYELSKLEGKIGTPEKPLSDLGLLGYRSYWSQVILDVLEKYLTNITIRDIAQMTAIQQDDIIATLQYLKLTRYWKGQYIISVTPKIIEDHKRTLAESRRGPRCDPAHLDWAPPVPEPSTPSLRSK